MGVLKAEARDLDKQCRPDPLINDKNCQKTMQLTGKGWSDKKKNIFKY